MQGAERLLWVQTIFQSKEDSIYGAAIGPLLGKKASCVKGQVCPLKWKRGFCSKVSSYLFPSDSSFPTCNSYALLCPLFSLVGTRDLNSVSLFINFCMCRNRLFLWNEINMGLVAFFLPQRNKETASSTPVWNLSSHQMQTASLIPAAVYSPT